MTTAGPPRGACAAARPTASATACSNASVGTGGGWLRGRTRRRAGEAEGGRCRRGCWGCRCRSATITAACCSACWPTRTSLGSTKSVHQAGARRARPPARCAWCACMPPAEAAAPLPLPPRGRPDPGRLRPGLGSGGAASTSGGAGSGGAGGWAGAASPPPSSCTEAAAPGAPCSLSEDEVSSSDDELSCLYRDAQGRGARCIPAQGGAERGKARQRGPGGGRWVEGWRRPVKSL